MTTTLTAKHASSEASSALEAAKTKKSGESFIYSFKPVNFTLKQFRSLVRFRVWIRCKFMCTVEPPSITVGAFLKSWAHTRLRHSCKASSIAVFANPNSICAFRLTGSEWAGRVRIGTVKKIAYRILSCIESCQRWMWEKPAGHEPSSKPTKVAGENKRI